MKKNLIKTLIMAMAVTAMVGTTGITSFAAETATTTQTTKQTLDVSVVAKVFDAAYYAEKNPDVVAVIGNDPAMLLKHYIDFGIYEGRDASATFNADAYLSANTDLATVFGNNLEAAIEHYGQFGVNENRIATVTGATAAGITVTSATNPELVIATPAPKMTKGASYSGGGSGSGSSVSGGSSSVGQKAYINLSTGEVTTTPSFGYMDMDTFRSDITYDNNRGVLLNYNDDGSAQYIKFGETIKMNDGTVARLSGDANNYSINTYDVVTKEQQQSWIDSGIAVVTHMDGTVEGSFENSPAQGVDESNCEYHDYAQFSFDD